MHAQRILVLRWVGYWCLRRIIATVAFFKLPARCSMRNEMHDEPGQPCYWTLPKLYQGVSVILFVAPLWKHTKKKDITSCQQDNTSQAPKGSLWSIASIQWKAWRQDWERGRLGHPSIPKSVVYNTKMMKWSSLLMIAHLVSKLTSWCILPYRRRSSAKDLQHNGRTIALYAPQSGPALRQWRVSCLLWTVESRQMLAKVQ